MKHSLFYHALAALALLAFLSDQAPAQLESGTRPLNREGFGGAWYSDTNPRVMFQMPFPIIRSMPPLNSGMPWEVMGAYIVADSIARFDRKNLTAKLVTSWSAPNDTLRGLVKYLYMAVDYNPLIFKQYGFEVAHGWGGRKPGLLRAIDEAREALPRVATERSEARALNAAFYAGNVLRVRVTAIDSMPFPNPASGWGAKVSCRATVQVLDTLKGRYIPSCQQEFGQDRKGARLARPASGEACTFITFNNVTYWDPRQYDYDPFYARDPAFCTADSSFIMHVGQEAVVFLNYHSLLVDSTHDYFELAVEPIASFGALPIIDGRVRDVNRIWSGDLWTDYDAWRRRFFQIRDKIINGTF